MSIIMNIGQQYIFPFAKIEKESRIIIYGLGEVGQHYLAQVLSSKYCTIVACVDMNYASYNRDHISIVSPHEINKLSYDMIVIAIESDDLRTNIKTFLCLNMGIPSNKIFDSKPCRLKQSYTFLRYKYECPCVDVLFINGENRRNDNLDMLILQLKMDNLSTAEIFLAKAEKFSGDLCRNLIFFHCNNNVLVEQICHRAKSLNKSIWIYIENRPILFKDVYMSWIDGYVIQTKVNENTQYECIRYIRGKQAINTFYDFSELIRLNQHKNFIMILPFIKDILPGGILVALQHCRILQKKGYDVVVAIQKSISDFSLLNSYRDKGFAFLCLRNLRIQCHFDNAIATSWETNLDIKSLGAKQLYYLVQGYEPDFFPRFSKEYFSARNTYFYCNNTHYVTISKWCKKWLEDEFHQKVRYAPNGLDTHLFFAVRRDFNYKIRILIIGPVGAKWKNVDEAFRITNCLNRESYEIWYIGCGTHPRAWYRLDRFFLGVAYNEMPAIYRKCHILLHTSIYESFSYPPLEMMATGGFVVVRENDGNREYLCNGINCLFYNPDDLLTAVQQIEYICHSNELRKKLYCGGQQTASKRRWKQVEQEIMALYE